VTTSMRMAIQELWAGAAQCRGRSDCIPGF
jgi:hypothetical protein